MTKLVHGEVGGLTWYEVPRAALYRYSPDGEPWITVLAPKGKLPDPVIEKMLLETPEKTNTLASEFPFRPIDTETELPGRKVAYNRFAFGSEDIAAWAHENLDLPPELDLSFAVDEYKKTIHVFAETVKNGRLVKVQRKLDTEKLFGDALAEHLPYFQRNCRKPDGPVAEFTCGAHVASALSRMTRNGVKRAEEWLQRHRERGLSCLGAGCLTIPGDMLPGSSIDSIDLYIRDGNTIIANILVQGGHKLTDDKTGVEITLDAKIPVTVLTALRGRSFGDVIDAEWARELKIRTVREASDGGKTTMRAFAEGVPFVLPAPTMLTDEDYERQIKNAGEGRCALVEVQDAAIPVLRELSREDLATVISLIQAGEKVELSRFGHDGWTLRGQGPRIIVEDSPNTTYRDFVEEILARPTSAD